ncbi:hypothetical protein ABWL39_07630 [Chitinivorax sp. PXF-14]|uniref:hypothetical protein n=1 Tax=Chitinivorax sp. PXF-14 TaxID=3230488 RepID=UPI0034666A4B
MSYDQQFPLALYKANLGLAADLCNVMLESLQRFGSVELEALADVDVASLANASSAMLQRDPSGFLKQQGEVLQTLMGQWNDLARVSNHNNAVVAQDLQRAVTNWQSAVLQALGQPKGAANLGNPLADAFNAMANASGEMYQAFVKSTQDLAGAADAGIKAAAKPAARSKAA